MKASLLALALLMGVASTMAQQTVCPKYVVQSGDSLFAIAQKFNTLPDDLTAALQACGQQTDLLQVGQQICLPGADKPGCANVKSYNGNNNCKVYVVQQGDTIESVAGSLQIYRNDLDNLNKDVQSNGLLQPNKYLKLPPWSNSCGDPNKSGESCRLYIVNQGDFIAGIAAAYSVSVDDVLAVNPGLTADSVLQQSQPIKIPPFPASCGAGTPSKPPTDTVLKCRGYRVQQGEDINKIAQYFQTTVADINSVNPELVGGALVQPGTIIKIPPYDATCDKPILVTPGKTPSSSPAPVNPVPVPVIPSPVVTVSPSPVVVVPSPSPILSSPPPSPVAIPPAVVVVPTVAPSPAPIVLPPAVAPIPVVVTATPPPAPAPSSGVVPKAIMAVIAVAVAVLAF